MKATLMTDAAHYSSMTTQELRDAFLIDALYEPAKVHLTYVDLDRAVVGMAVPVKGALLLPNDPSLRASHFTERRELGVLNIGGSGIVRVGSASYELTHLDALYIGRGNPVVTFESKDDITPAMFYLVSYPAHAQHPVAFLRKDEADLTEIGRPELCNRRTICKYIYPEAVRSCQLMMGITHLQSGSNWNTMPPHTHMRRSEIYMYFNLPDDARVIHLMGRQEETRHIVVADKNVVVAPGWSIHSGVGTQAYSFIWSMGGENQEFADMDPAPLESLR